MSGWIFEGSSVNWSGAVGPYGSDFLNHGLENLLSDSSHLATISAANGAVHGPGGGGGGGGSGGGSGGVSPTETLVGATGGLQAYRSS
jgi:hypothetical protein